MKAIYSLTFILLSILLFSCNQTTTTEQPKAKKITPPSNLILETVGPAIFQAKIDAMEGEQIVDIRTLEELEKTGIIKGAIHLDYFDNDFNKKIDKLDREKPIMVYCKSGGRSTNTVDILNRWRFKAVYELKGGITDWINSGYPLEKYVADE